MANKLQVWEATQNDTLVPIGVQLVQKDEDGVLQPFEDLNTYTIKFYMVTDRGVISIVETTVGVTLIDNDNAYVQYDWVPADTTTSGVHWGYFTVYDGSDKRATFPKGRLLKIILFKDESA